MAKTLISWGVINIQYFLYIFTYHLWYLEDNFPFHMYFALPCRRCLLAVESEVIDQPRVRGWSITGQLVFLLLFFFCLIIDAGTHTCDNNRPKFLYVKLICKHDFWDLIAVSNCILLTVYKAIHKHAEKKAKHNGVT